MRTILTLLCLCLSIGAYSQKSFNKFYKKYKRSEDARTIALPGIAFKVGSVIAKGKMKDDPVASMAVKMAKKLKGVKMLMVEDYSPADRRSISDFMDGMRGAKKPFEDMFTFKTAGTDVHFLMRDNGGDIIKNLVILFNSEDDGLVLMNVKSKLNKSDLGELINMAIAQAKDEEYVEPEQEEQPKKEEKPVKKVPRA